MNPVDSPSYMPSAYLPMLVQFGLAIAFVAFAMIVSHLVGPSRHSRVKGEAFECGIESVGNARTPISVKYFLTAILFVLFDVEVIFMYPWAVNFRQLGTAGFVEMLIFLTLLMAGFGYVIKKGILRWNEEPSNQTFVAKPVLEKEPAKIAQAA